jgi:hypothetical protein
LQNGEMADVLKNVMASFSGVCSLTSTSVKHPALSVF